MASQRISGLHSVRTALRHGADRLVQVWFDAKRHDQRLRAVLGEFTAAGIKPQPVSKSELDQLAAGANHQGIVAETLAPAAMDEGYLETLLQGLETPPFLLVLDGVQDPHNLGACLRSADAAGVHAVLAPKDRAVGLTPVACKVASGAANTVPFVQVTNLVRTLRWLQEAHGIWLVGAAGAAVTSLYDTSLTGPLALIMGNEEKGMRRLTRDLCDQLVRLPMAGSVESLNVSVAAGVCLFEAVRQRSRQASVADCNPS